MRIDRQRGHALHLEAVHVPALVPTRKCRLLLGRPIQVELLRFLEVRVDVGLHDERVRLARSHLKRRECILKLVQDVLIQPITIALQGLPHWLKEGSMRADAHSREELPLDKGVADLKEVALLQEEGFHGHREDWLVHVPLDLPKAVQFLIVRDRSLQEEVLQVEQVDLLHLFSLLVQL